MSSVELMSRGRIGKKGPGRISRKRPEPDLSTRKWKSFLSGLLDGFGGPVLLSAHPQMFKSGSAEGTEGFLIRHRGLEDWPQTASLDLAFTAVGYSLSRAAEEIIQRHGLAAHIVREKRLDAAGKLRDSERIVLNKAIPSEDGKS